MQQGPFRARVVGSTPIAAGRFVRPSYHSPFSLDQIPEADNLMASRKCGNFAARFEEELAIK